MKRLFLTLLIATTCSYSLLAIGSAIATTLKIVESPKEALYAGISGTATSMRITPYPRDLDGVKLTMIDFGDNPTLTIDPGIKNIEEIIMFSNIVDNGDNTATITISGRDLSSKYPYVATGNGRSHGASAVVVFSNNPQVYGRLAAVENSASISGIWQFVTSPVVPDPTTALQVVNKEYVDGLAVTGTPKADPSTGGRVQIATGLQAASSTSLGSATGNPYLAITSSIATSTYGNGSTSGLKAVITQNDGHIDSNFIRQSDNFTWTPVGSITAYSTTTAPSGWLLANGTAISRSTYSALYTVIGTSYGAGDNSTTFNLPNLSGRTIIMATSTQTYANVLGETGGAISTVLTTSNLPTDSRQVIGYAGAYSTGSSYGSASATYGTGNSASPTTLNASGGVGTAILDPYIVLNYIIKY